MQHDNVRDLFEQFKKSTDKSERAMLSNTLVRSVAITLHRSSFAQPHR